jgi:hypothetical protein
MKKLDERSVGMVYFGVEEGSKAHRLYNPHTKKIVVSRDVIFEEVVCWQWSAEFGENSEFVVEENGEHMYQPWTGDQSGGGHVVVGAGDGDNHNDHNSGGADNDQYVEASSRNNFDDAIGNSVEIGEGSQSGTVHSQATEATSSENAELAEMDVDDTMDINEGPVRFRNLNEVYQDTVEVELTSDSEVETLLVVMEEPSCYQDAAGDGNWIKAMENEIQSINKNNT